eukprot:c3828_g1_i1.p1 GENE.c3828_g1_i1~~c3828_g1_i1.p1  ORF type:complete len:153 (+),score=67.09 c3828_g1_i1:108-566(+)
MSDTVKLVSEDGQTFESKRAAIEILQTVKYAIEASSGNEAVPVGNVKGDVLRKVLDFCEFNADATKTEDEKKAWKNEYIKVEPQVIVQLLLAADFLDCPQLLDVASQAVIDVLLTNSPAKILEHFKIKADASEAEKKEVRASSAWCEEYLKA